MHPHRHAVVFPLASNAKALLAGGPIASVRRRLKLCSLFFDTVLLESGAVHITAGPSGSMMFPVLPGKKGYCWQTSATRKHDREPARLFFRTEGETSGAWELGMQTQATVDWRPTFEPFRDELPPEAVKWLRFVQVKSNPLLKRVADAGVRADQRIEVMRRHLPDPMVRDQVLRGLNLDLAASGLEGIAISMDAEHRKVLACRRHVGAASPVCGPQSLRLLFPRVEHLPWTDIAELRNHRDIDAFRKLLVDIEAAAAEAESGGFDGSVQKAYADAVATAQQRMNGSNLRQLGLRIFGMLSGFLLNATLGVPPVVSGTIGIGVGMAAGQGIRAALAPKWRAFDRSLRERLDMESVATVEDRVALGEVARGRLTVGGGPEQKV